MFKKLASSLILGSLLASSAFAGDFLAKISNGALSDNSQGVKALNLDEMKQIVGGAFYHRISKLDKYGYKVWLASDVMYITTDMNRNLKSNSGTDSVRKKMGYSGNGIVILGVKDQYNNYGFVLYDTKGQLKPQLVRNNNYYIQNELKTFKANAK
ncbi:hypothetical protein HJ549_001820 [Campylobacter coli]|nr:hypothetical protein [Campylobacter coli]EGF7601453.1 hypothetical protein [Salmonella enterica subsp. enterica serovar Infantis]EAH6977979.1 hypothetical protein [Campylobacter coli]EAH9196415.1 hypothetical protein [Campylobacter coli]EAI6518140.1 hypothetical protein [Campylobacter coli]